jgi:zinc-ribbon domain
VFCPKCGVKNVEEVKFCRACGANIQLVPQVLRGELTEADAAGGTFEERVRRRGRKQKEPPTLEKAFENVFGGLAFLLVFFLGYFYYQGAFIIWVWFIIPGLEHIGKGIGQAVRAGRERPALAAPRAAEELPAHQARELTAPDTSEIVTPPPTVTESTTRSLAGRQ